MSEAPFLLKHANRTKSVLRVMDWVLAFGFLGYGLYQMNWFFIVVGLLSVGLAVYNPARRVETKVQQALKARMATDKQPPAAS